MGIITGGAVIPSIGDFYGTGAAVNGTNAVHTVTFTNATGGTFKLQYDGNTTAGITWSATAATLVANMQAALDSTIGTNSVTVANSTLNAGNGAVTITFAGPGFARRVVAATNAVYSGLINGTNATVAVNTVTTNGVNATALNALEGGRYTDLTNGKLYVNVGADGSPSWAVQA